MMTGINTEIQSAGGGGYGGLGLNGTGTNPLLWLITLAFLRENGGLGGNGSCDASASQVARANEGITCLSNGQDNIIQQQQFDRLSQGMDATGNRIVSAVGDLSNDFNSFSRDLNMTLCNGFNDTQVRQMQSDFSLTKQIADCCCDLKSGQKDIENAVCQQTNTLLTAGTANTQRIIDTITSNKIQELESQLNQANTAIALSNQTNAIIQACGCCPGGSIQPQAQP